MYRREKCLLCNGHGQQEFEADRVQDYRYMPCTACGGLSFTITNLNTNKRLTVAEIRAARTPKTSLGDPS